jgi:ribose-phosphate pyrophosphokinase
VEIEVPPLEPWSGRTPVLVDDIVSTAGTMIETVTHLRRARYPAPVCVGVHGLFAGDAYAALKRAGAGTIVTANTVPHPSNRIDLTEVLAGALRELLDPPPDDSASETVP